MTVFEAFEKGRVFLSSGQVVELASTQWQPHAVFEGVELKHLITAKDTEGAYSYHLVRISPNCAIGTHAHDTQLETHEVIAGSGVGKTNNRDMCYEVGTISILPAGVEHEVLASDEGLCLFAKFLPALC